MHQVRDKRPGVASRTKITNLTTECEGAETARWKFERGQPTEVFTTSIETERWIKKSLKV